MADLLFKLVQLFTGRRLEWSVRAACGNQRHLREQEMNIILDALDKAELYLDQFDDLLKHQVNRPHGGVWWYNVSDPVAYTAKQTQGPSSSLCLTFARLTLCLGLCNTGRRSSPAHKVKVVSEYLSAEILRALISGHPGRHDDWAIGFMASAILPRVEDKSIQRDTHVVLAFSLASRRAAGCKRALNNKSKRDECVSLALVYVMERSRFDDLRRVNLVLRGGLPGPAPRVCIKGSTSSSDYYWDTGLLRMVPLAAGIDARRQAAAPAAVVAMDPVAVDITRNCGYCGRADPGQVARAAARERPVDCPTAERKLLQCGQCVATFYCDAGCQRGAWPVHKLSCRPPVHDTNTDNKNEAATTTPAAHDSSSGQGAGTSSSQAPSGGQGAGTSQTPAGASRAV